MYKNKYHAKPTYVGDIRFDSKKEAKRWQELGLLERAGEIKNLRRQVEFELIPKTSHGRRIVYRADFVYDIGGQEVVEDAKGVKTDVYRLKRRMMAERYGIIIQEV